MPFFLNGFVATQHYDCAITHPDGCVDLFLLFFSFPESAMNIVRPTLGAGGALTGTQPQPHPQRNPLTIAWQFVKHSRRGEQVYILHLSVHAGL